MAVTSPLRSRAEAVEADRVDPLAGAAALYHCDPAGPIYLDSNSLGRQPVGAAARVAEVLEVWRHRLVEGWQEWVELPGRVGDRVGRLVGAAPGQVVVADSTTVNLHKLVLAALAARPQRRVIVFDPHDFPTVRYALQAIAGRGGYQLRPTRSHPREGVDPDSLAAAIDDDVAAVCLSGVNFRSGAVLDLAAASACAHHHGALVVWDLSHAAGALPLALDASGTDLAVGCGYKYLAGGPGAPAWLYVRRDLQAQLDQPVWGWWGQRDRFAMAEAYQPELGMERFCSGTPAVIGIVSLDAGLEPLLRVGMDAVWSKTRRLVELLDQRAASVLGPLGVGPAGPSDPSRRGGHLALAHPLAAPLVATLSSRGTVIADSRPPEVLRLAPAALTTSYTQAWDAVDRVAEALSELLGSAARPAGRRPAPDGRSSGVAEEPAQGGEGAGGAGPSGPDAALPAR